MSARHILAIDQGTTSSRAVIFDAAMMPVASAQKELTQHYPQSGWVEHDPEEIWRGVVETVRDALSQAGLTASDLAGIGITNQRETTVVWDRATGEPIHRAIVWQDRRTARLCDRLRRDGLEPHVRRTTGLLIDPYFSATKIGWILDHVGGARRRAGRGELAAGTIDSFLLWRLTGGRVHATDATNASRTMLFDISHQRWDARLLAALKVPEAILPQVKDCADDFGQTDPALFGAAVPILGVAGDQQAATIGQACFSPGDIKATFGTGAFILLNTGERIVRSRHRLLSTIAYRIGDRATYALEGSVFIAGAAVQWLRDELGIVERASDVDGLAASADPAQQIHLVPAFTGLGAPYWDSDARGAIFGLTRDTGRAEIARAALEAVAFQTCDLLDAMRRDMKDGKALAGLRVDGGMAASDLTMQALADLSGLSVQRPKNLETTVLGAAWLAGWRAGLYRPLQVASHVWNADREFRPAIDERARKSRLRGWRAAVERTRTG